MDPDNPVVRLCSAGMRAEAEGRQGDARDLKTLGLILHAYLGDLGTDDDRTRLATALHMVHAARGLPEEDQEALGRAISAFA